MLTLLFFAAIAGALTAVTPCVLPVLPGLLSASGTGGRRRPTGVVIGLVTTHFLTIVALATVVEGVGLADGATRTLAILVLAGVGLSLLWPPAMHWIEARLAPLTRLGPRNAGDGFGSGLLVGGALGFVYAPCAGPILAAVISVSATQGATGRTIAVAAAYSIGSAAALFAVAKGGRKLLAGRAAELQRASGAILLATAVLMAADLDTRFQTALANDFPSFLSNPTKGIENSDSVQAGLEKVRGKAKFEARQEEAQAGVTGSGTSPGTGEAAGGGRPANLSDEQAAAVPAKLPVLGTAPELKETGQWFNGQPTTLKRLRGRVVLIDFWTYSCINCIRTFPALRTLDERYRDKGLTIVGVHTPEFGFEKDAGNVADAIKQNKLRYPVVQDNEYGTWDAFGNNAWPGKYLIDAEGKVRYTHLGEGDDAKTEAAVRSLLKEAGASGVDGRAPAPAQVETIAEGVSTEETYLGTERARGFAEEPVDGEHDYTAPATVPTDGFALGGRWKAGPESALALRDAVVKTRFNARKVYLVLASKGDAPRKVQVLLDGEPIAASLAGEDVKGGAATVTGQRLYRLVDVGSVSEHDLELRLAPGVRAFAFTFG
ncbi:Protein DipZ [Paraconexibacter sp. AEG42_29]|uniref:Protein DipZ n=1 Tax=Paraconexibacter sp. AEG42_29 TaxID=2997339 RepID=A0AAU7AQW9_9ACTN